MQSLSLFNKNVPQVQTRVVLMTPEMAAALLERNTDNRHVRKPHVKYLAGIIERGEWILTNQGVGISKSGRLLDGQHRLMAIVMADKPVNIQVTEGLDDEAYMAIDTGITRSGTDVTKLPQKLVAVLRRGYIAHAVDVGSPKVSAQEYHKLLNTEFGKMCKRVTDVSSSKPGLGNAKLLFGVVLACLEGSPDYSIGIYEQVKEKAKENFLNGYANLPPATQNFIRQLGNGDLFKGQDLDVVIKTYKATSKKFANVKILRVDVDLNRKDFVRKLVSPWM